MRTSDPGDVAGYDAFMAGGYTPPDQTPRVEGNACLAVLRAGGVAAWRVRKHAGLTPQDRMTFRHLREAVGFAAAPAVTGELPDDVVSLLTGLPKTKLWRAWVRAWDDRPECPPGSRVLVAAGPGWGTIVAYDGPPPDTSHVHLPGPAGGITVELLRPWARRVWTASPFDAR